MDNIEKYKEIFVSSLAIKENFTEDLKYNSRVGLNRPHDINVWIRGRF